MKTKVTYEDHTMTEAHPAYNRSTYLGQTMMEPPGAGNQAGERPEINDSGIRPGLPSDISYDDLNRVEKSYVDEINASKKGHR